MKTKQEWLKCCENDKNEQQIVIMKTKKNLSNGCHQKWAHYDAITSPITLCTHSPVETASSQSATLETTNMVWQLSTVMNSSIPTTSVVPSRRWWMSKYDQVWLKRECVREWVTILQYHKLAYRHDTYVRCVWCVRPFDDAYYECT
jgi:hypothetical protein